MGGIHCSLRDVGAPAPYAAVEESEAADRSRVLLRDPGYELWAQVLGCLDKFGNLLHLCADRKRDFLELLLGAAFVVLDLDPLS